LIMRRNLLAAAFFLAGGALAPASATPDPAAFIKDLGNQALAVLGPQTTPAQRQARFRALFRQDFDVPAIARFVLGRYWRVATPTQQREFVALFENYVVMAYSNRLSQYSGEQLRVVGSRLEPGGAIVYSEIVRPHHTQPVKVEWRLTRSDSHYKISDVVVEGISMAITQRSEFASVIQRHGGQVQGLLAMLREKVADLSH
jgi:phospholipid transport system substrate-binding protein